MATDQTSPDQVYEALRLVLDKFEGLSQDERRRVLESVATFYAITPIGAQHGFVAAGTKQESSSSQQRPAFSSDLALSPKEFLMEKQPRTDVERVACLAYYLTHFRDQPHFKTLDLTQLNTEAAQPKFSNAAYSTNNAVKTRYLVPSTKGHRQLSAVGEQFVLALPDREAAKAAMASMRPRRKSLKARRARLVAAETP
jgi:hypothetical protein